MNRLADMPEVNVAVFAFLLNSSRVRRRET